MQSLFAGVAEELPNDRKEEGGKAMQKKNANADFC